MAQSGYQSDLLSFSATDEKDVLDSLKAYIPDAGKSQIVAWKDSIVILKRLVSELLAEAPGLINDCSILLEYTIPLESRRIDALLLLKGVVLVVEFKGKLYTSLADIDQAAAYARDLRAYHKACAQVPVRCVLVPTQCAEACDDIGDVDVIGSAHLTSYVADIQKNDGVAPKPQEFEWIDCYQPLPSLIKAARELFNSGSLTRIHRAAAATEPTLQKCSDIVHDTARRKRRALILITGVPGAGKTLVGLQLAHAKYLDDLSVVRTNGEKPNAAAVFLSGNGPLVEVLQYELKSAGGDGKAFVRGVHEYVKTFTKKAGLVPPQHVLIYDEAQRAFDAAQVNEKHKYMPSEFVGLSEPELFIQFAERVPDWCVVVGLIGSGQEIHIGEEAGLGQWRDAIEKSSYPTMWDIYCPDNEYIKSCFEGVNSISHENVLELSETIRFHLASKLYDFVQHVLEGRPSEAREVSYDLEKNGYNLRLSHDLAVAKQYLVDRYNQNPDARFGVIASAKDKDLKDHGIPKGFKSPGEVGPGKYGRWYSNPQFTDGSCTCLESVATEFGTQGLELDASLLAWGTDFVRKDGCWTNEYASGYRDKHRIVDAKALRMNAYRVLLTRGRDASVVFIPPIPEKMRESYSYLKECGFKDI